MNQTREKTKQLIENCRLICRNEPDKIENWLDLGRALLEDAQYDEAEQALTKIFDEGRFFSFKNGIPRVRLKTLFHWKKNKLAYAKAYADLAFVSVHQANLAEAERLLSMALRVFEELQFIQIVDKYTVKILPAPKTDLTNSAIFNCFA